MFCIIGAAFAIGSTTYTVGSGARMGPGYVPLMLGVVLILLGGVFALLLALLKLHETFSANSIDPVNARANELLKYLGSVGADNEARYNAALSFIESMKPQDQADPDRNICPGMVPDQGKDG